MRANYARYARALARGIRRLFGRAVPPPEDPYSYVTAPKKPKRPSLTAAAVAELPKN
jgi:hypothetical protein